MEKYIIEQRLGIVINQLKNNEHFTKTFKNAVLCSFIIMLLLDSIPLDFFLLGCLQDSVQHIECTALNNN